MQNQMQSHKIFEEFDMLDTPDGLKFKLFHPNSMGRHISIAMPAKLFGPHREHATLNACYQVSATAQRLIILPNLDQRPDFPFLSGTYLLPTDTPSKTYTPYGYTRIPGLNATARYICQRYTDGRVETVPCRVKQQLAPLEFEIETESGWSGAVPRKDLLADGEVIEKPVFYGDTVRRLSDGRLFNLCYRHTYGWHGTNEDGELGILEHGDFEPVFQMADCAIGNKLPDGRKIINIKVCAWTPSCIRLSLDDGSTIKLKELLK